MKNKQEYDSFKGIPRQKMRFKKNDLVLTPYGTMIVVNGYNDGYELEGNEWIPRITCAHITKNGTIDKRKNSLLVPQSKIPF